MRISNIKSLDNLLMPNDFTPYVDFLNKDINKLMWACPIILNKEKVSCNFIVPVVVKLNEHNNKYNFFTPYSPLVESLVDKTVLENKLSYTKVKYMIPYNEGIHQVSRKTNISKWDIALFDNPIECNEYRKAKEKELRDKINLDKDKSKRYTVTIEDIETKFNIPHGKLIIEGVWNDPYTKSKRKK